MKDHFSNMIITKHTPKGRLSMRIACVVALGISLMCGAECATYLSSGNGDCWDDDANWSSGVFPNAAGAGAAIGVPTAFKKNKGWRNIHINASDVAVGVVEMTCGGCTNRIDTGDVGGSLTFDGGDADATFTVMDASGAGLAMIDLDEPNVVSLATHTTFTVPGGVGDAEYGGVLLKGAWAGNGKNLKKSGDGLMTLAFTNAAGSVAFGKIQVDGGTLAILQPIVADSITKSGFCRVLAGAATPAEAAAVSVVCSGKVSVDHPCLFVPADAAGGTFYGGFVAPSLTDAASCAVYVPDAAGDVLFDGQAWAACASATVAVVDAGDGLNTYAVTVAAAGDPSAPRPVSGTLTFETTAPALGSPIVVQLKGTGLTNVVYRWSTLESDGFYGTVLDGDTNEYTPCEADLEHWIRVEAYQDGVRVCENRLYFSRLPVVYLDTNDGEPVVEKGEYRDAQLVIQGNALFPQQYAGKTQVKGRGNSSWFYPQKPLKLKLSKKTDLFGFGANKHWVLLSSFVDVSALRNESGSLLAKALGLASMDMTAVTLIYNGDYHGVYELSEHIRVDENRIDIFNWEDEAESVAGDLFAAVKSEDGLTSQDEDALVSQMGTNMSWITTGSVSYKDKTYSLDALGLRKEYDLSGGYLFESTLLEEDISKFWTPGRMHIVAKSPEYLATDPSMLSVVTSYWARFESAYLSPTGVNPQGESFSDLADLDSMAAYWLVNVVMDNIDACENSRYASIDIGGRLVFGPVWDFDCGGCARHGFSNYDHWSCLEMPISDANGETGHNFFRIWPRLPAFRQRILEMYWTQVHPWMEAFLESGGLLDQQIAYLAEAGKSQDARWCGAPFPLWGNLALRTVAEDSSIYKNYLVNRLNWLDAQFATIDTLTASLFAVLSPDTPSPSPLPTPPTSPTTLSLLADPLADAPFAGAPAVYFGWLKDAGGSVAGTISLKVGKPGRDGLSKVTATIQMSGGQKRTVRATMDASGVLQGDLAGLVLGANGLRGSWSGLVAEGGLDVSKKRQSSEVSVLQSFKGKSYAAAFSVEGSPGYTLLSIVFSSKGKARATLIGSDGKKRSLTRSLVYGEAYCGLPLDGKDKSGHDFALVAWFSHEGAFEGITEMKPGWTELNRGVVEAASGLSLSFSLDPVAVSALAPAVLGDYLPLNVPVSVDAKGAWQVAGKAGRVEVDRATGATAATTDNPSALKLACARGTGLISGKFSAYELWDARLKKQNVTVVGLLVNGWGYANAVFGKLGITATASVMRAQ